MARLRLAWPADAPDVRDIYAPIVEETVISFELTPPPVDEMRRRIEETIDRLPWLVCEHDERVVGYAAAHPHRERAAYRWAVDTSVYVAETARGCGVGRGLYEALFEVLREQSYVHAYAGTTLPNPASEGLHEATGFEPIGTYERVGAGPGTTSGGGTGCSWTRPTRPTSRCRSTRSPGLKPGTGHWHREPTQSTSSVTTRRRT